MGASYMTGPATTNEDLATRRKIALALMQKGMDTSPVQHWTQGAARALQGALGGYELYRAGQDAEASDARRAEFQASLLPQQQEATSPQTAPGPLSPIL